MEALQRLHNRGSISTGYDIDNSLKFETDNSEYLKAEGRPQGDSQQTWTWSCWVKRTEVDNGVVAQYLMSAGSDGKLGIYFRDDASYPDDRIFLYIDEGNSLKWIGQVNQSFRDTSAWYHIVLAVDSTDSTAADRTKIYVNGVQQTITFNATLNQNVSTRVGDGGGKFSIGAKMDGSYGFNGYMAECVLVDGSALTPTSFGEYDDDSGIWKPKDVSDLSLGTTGFHMNFDDSSNVGAVQSGTSQGNFDKYNLSAADQATDTPTNNFCTMNMLDRTNGNSKNQEGATKVTTDGGSGWCSMVATMGVTKGKWYWETQRSGGSSDSNDVVTGIVGSEDAYIPYSSAAQYYIGNVATSSSIGYYQKNYPSQEGTVVNGVSLNFYSQGGDTIMFGLDMDNEKMYFGLNGTWKGTGDSIGGNTAGASSLHADFDGEFVLPAVAVYQGKQIKINFGGYASYTISSAASDADGYGTFEYAPPSGYYALCTKNLEEYG